MPPKASEKLPAESKTTDAAKVSAARQRELDAAISTITKSYGDGAIMRLGDAQALKKIEVIPTGALAVDLALGVGGVPRGRVIEIFGPESSGRNPRTHASRHRQCSKIRRLGSIHRRGTCA